MKTMKNTLLDGTNELSANVQMNGSNSNRQGNIINLTINSQHLNEAELNNILNYINIKFGVAF